MITHSTVNTVNIFNLMLINSTINLFLSCQPLSAPLTLPPTQTDNPQKTLNFLSIGIPGFDI